MVDHRLFGAGEETVAAGIPRVLFALLGPPVLWASHLSLCYFLVTLDCITGWDGAGWAVAAATAAFAAGAVGAGVVAHRLWREANGEEPGGADGWVRFMAVLGMGGAVLFTAVIVLTGFSPAFVAMCA